MVVLLFCLWIILSGELTLRSCLTGAALSALVYLPCCKYLGYRPRRELLAVKKLGVALGYLFYLLGEMLKAGLVVMKLIYTKGRHMEPRLIWFDTDLQSDRARAALADAITLTAGTITISQEGGTLCVHTLDASLAEGLECSGFARRLLELEKRT